MRYPVVEIFKSIQGEGFYTGHPVVFIRLAGCPNKCPFCDTDQSKFQEMHVQDIVGYVRELLQSRVVITGGEPTIHNLVPLVDELHARIPQLSLHLETSGIGKLPHFIDWVTFSPKRGTAFNPSCFMYADEIKWLYPMWDLDAIYSLYEHTPISMNHAGHAWHYLQPINDKMSLNKTNVQGAVDAILSNTGKINFILSLQLHKLIGVR